MNESLQMIKSIERRAMRTQLQAVLLWCREPWTCRICGADDRQPHPPTAPCGLLVQLITALEDPPS
jgi:hypothetical protein